MTESDVKRRYVLEFSIPGLPPMANAGARHKHWRVVQKETLKWKNLVWAAILGKKPPQPLTKAKLTLTRCSSMEPDFDGLVSGFKSAVDALKDHGVIASDKPSVIGQPKYEWRKAKQKEGKIIVKVEAGE